MELRGFYQSKDCTFATFPSGSTLTGVPLTNLNERDMGSWRRKQRKIEL